MIGAAAAPVDAADGGVAGADGASVFGDDAAVTGAAGGTTILDTDWIGEPCGSASLGTSDIILPGDAPLRIKVIVAITPLPLTGEARTATI